jgi:DNA-binding CsgD family transcriptional regulator
MTALASTLNALGEAAFPAAFSAFCHAATGADLCVVYTVEAGAPTDNLLRGGALAGPVVTPRIEHYLCEAWRADPCRSALSAPTDAITRLSPERMRARAYRRFFYDDLGIGDRLALSTVAGSARYHVNLYRRGESFADGARDWLREQAPILGALVHRHRTLRRVDPFAVARDAMLVRGLSPREIDVCLMILDDVPELYIADQLDLSPHSVVTYRRRAYLKLGVASRAGLRRLVTRQGDRRR